jgi:hypothetical protein
MCPHCGFLIRTTKIITPGAKARCPSCRQAFQITPSGECLVETIPVVGARSEPVEGPLPPRMPTSKETAEPRATAQSGPGQIANPKPLDGRRTEPFHSSHTVVVSALLLVLMGGGWGFVSWYSSQINILTKKVDRGADVRKTKIAGLADPKVVTALGCKKSGGFGPLGRAPALPDDPDRATAPTTAQVEHVVIGVSECRVGEVPLRSHRTTPKAHMIITLRITNLYEAPFGYDGRIGSNDPATMRDSFKNFYHRITFDPSDPPAGVVDKVTIPKGTTITDVLVFEQLPTCSDLDLDLPVGPSTGAFKFRIPSAFIKRPARDSFGGEGVFPCAYPIRLDGATRVPTRDFRDLSRLRLRRQFLHGLGAVEIRQAGLAFAVVMFSQQPGRVGLSRLIAKDRLGPADPLGGLAV